MRAQSSQGVSTVHAYAAKNARQDNIQEDLWYAVKTSSACVATNCIHSVVVVHRTEHIFM